MSFLRFHCDLVLRSTASFWRVSPTELTRLWRAKKEGIEFVLSSLMLLLLPPPSPPPPFRLAFFSLLYSKNTIEALAFSVCFTYMYICTWHTYLLLLIKTNQTKNVCISFSSSSLPKIYKTAMLSSKHGQKMNYS